MITGGNKISGVSGPVQLYTPRAKGNKSVRAQGSSGRFDSVTLSEESRGSFAAQLTGRLSQEVRARTTPGRLNSLKEQVEAGEYQPDPLSIARRMLLLPEDR